MPAFLAMVEGDEGHVGGVYFTKRNIEARRAVCDEWQDGELGGATVRRMPHFDKYEERGRVPMADMMLEGWWSECYNCWKKLTVDEQYDDDDNEFYINPDDVIGDFGGPCFCCQECHDKWHRERDIKRMVKAELENTMKAKIESKFGVEGIEYRGFHAHVTFDDKGPIVQEASVRFDVPGCQHGGMLYRLDDKEHTREPTYTMTYLQRDHAAVAAFFLERTGRVLDNPESSD